MCLYINVIYLGLIVHFSQIGVFWLGFLFKKSYSQNETSTVAYNYVYIVSLEW